MVMSSNIKYRLDIITDDRHLKTWIGSITIRINTIYPSPQDPQLRRIVIPHSFGDLVDSISNLISAFTIMPEIKRQNPRTKVYSKDSSLLTDISIFKAPPLAFLTSQMLYNAGCVTTTFLHHIL